MSLGPDAFFGEEGLSFPVPNGGWLVEYGFYKMVPNLEIDSLSGQR